MGASVFHNFDSEGGPAFDNDGACLVNNRPYGGCSSNAHTIFPATLFEYGASGSLPSLKSLGSGTFDLKLGGSTSGGRSPSLIDVDWKLTLYVTDVPIAPAVPIPSAVWLFGSGLIGLAGFARRKKI